MAAGLPDGLWVTPTAPHPRVRRGPCPGRLQRPLVLRALGLAWALGQLCVVAWGRPRSFRGVPAPAPLAWADLQRLCPGSVASGCSRSCLCFQFGQGGRAGCRLHPRAPWLSEPELSCTTPPSRSCEHGSWLAVTVHALMGGQAGVCWLS